MTTDEPEGFVALVEQLEEVFAEEDWEGIEEFVQGRDDLEYVATMPFSDIALPPSNPEDVLPAGFEMRDLRAPVQAIDRIKASGSDESQIVVPDGLTRSELMRFWKAIRLYLDSGARVSGSIQNEIAFFREWLSTPGLGDDPLVVVDEEGRVIVGLAQCWAMAEIDGFESIPAVILKDVPHDAGRIYTSHVAKRIVSSTWSIEERRDNFEGATPEAKEFARGMDWIYHREAVTLTCSADTLDRLGLLIRKQLGSSNKLDPAQLLYVESLREAILGLRQRLIREGRTEGEVVAKLEKHLKEEREMLARGAKIEAKKGWRWEVDENGLFTHPAVARYRFKIVDGVEPSPPLLQDEPESSPYLMPLSQFQILARTHFGLNPDEAKNVYESDSPEVFTRRLKSYVAKVGEVAPKVKGAPSEAERERQNERLDLWIEGHKN